MKNNKKIFLIVLFSLFFSSSIFSATKNIQSIFNDGVQAQEEQNLYLACQYFLEVVNENHEIFGGMHLLWLHVIQRINYK